MPRFFASFTDSKESSMAVSEMAGVMPVMWNQSTPAKAASQSMSPGFARAMAEYSRSYTTLEGSWFAPPSR